MFFFTFELLNSTLSIVVNELEQICIVVDTPRVKQELGSVAIRNEYLCHTKVKTHHRIVPFAYREQLSIVK